MKSNKHTSLLNFLLLTIVLGCADVSAAKIIKWIDSNGKTHYGDRPPMPKDARQSSELNQSGVKLHPTGAGVESKPKAIVKEQRSKEQERHDHALINSYSSVDEIEIARKRNIKIDQLTLESLKLKQKKLQASVAENQQSNSTEISALQSIELQIKRKEKLIAETNARYREDKARYLELTSGR